MNGTEIVSTLSKGIDMLAKKFRVNANKIYPILLKQTYVDMYIKIFILILSICMFAVTIISTKKYLKSLKTEGSFFYKNWNTRGIYSSSDGFTTVLSAIGLVALGLFSIGLVTREVTGIIQIVVNPQYYIFTQYIQPLIK